MLFLCFILLGVSYKPPLVQGSDKGIKVGVVVSELSEAYPNIQRAGGTYEGEYIQPKGYGSSIKNKRIKAKLLLEKMGYDVDYVYDKELEQPEALSSYGALFFPTTVQMSYKQRDGVKEYIKNGGGVFMAFAFARNDSDRYPYKETDLDRTAIIYDTRSWIWEWDNISEPIQSAFINDVVVGDYSITQPSQSHPIISNSLNQLDTDSISLKNERKSKFGYSGDWIEVIKPYQGASVTPLLVYDSIGYSQRPEHTPHNTGAAYAMEYGKGKAVWFGFQLMDYMKVENDLTDEWEGFRPDGSKHVRGENWDGLIGGEQLKVLINNSIKWLAESRASYLPIDQNATIDLTGARAYPRSGDYVFYGTMTSANRGNMVSRGTMIAELVDPHNKVVRKYEKYIVGMTPKGSSYPEKIMFTLPADLTEGKYILRTTYYSGKRNQQQFKISADKQIINIKNRLQPAVMEKEELKDVNSFHWAKGDIDQLNNLGVITGYADGSFKPEQPVNRLQAATMLVRALDLDTANRPNPGLKDIKPGQYGYDVIATVVDEGIFSGANGSFNSSGYLTREQMAKILVNAFNLTGEEPVNFTDISHDQWSKPFISTLLANNITRVVGEYRPGQSTTRAQFATFVRRGLIAGVK
jgi:hypothetical protein